MQSINVNNKICAPKLIFFNEKNNEKDSDDCHKKLTLKDKLSHFLTPAHCTNSQNSMIIFGYLC